VVPCVPEKGLAINPTGPCLVFTERDARSVGSMLVYWTLCLAGLVVADAREAVLFLHILFCFGVVRLMLM
jgi:hypothetical protein